MTKPTVCLLFLILSLAGQPIHAQAPQRENLSVFSSDATKVAALKRGVEVMKARQPSDPTSWFYQAAIHGVSADAIAAAEAIDPSVASVDQSRFWNRCPHNGEASADFLPWHRAYIYYFEEILRDAAGDESLRVPYWDYSGTDRSFPARFADPEFASPTSRVPTNSLYEPGRELAFVFGMFELSDRAVSSARAFGETDFFGTTDSSGFAGGVSDANPRTQGAIESSPHNGLHFAIGGAIGDDAVGLMASVATAAHDPIFWVHHSNIDRLWSRWDCLPNRRWGAIPARTWFTESPWDFHRPDGSVVSPTREQLLTHGFLKISYDDDDPACTPLSANVPVPASGPSPVPSPVFSPAAVTVVGSFDEVLALSSSEESTATVVVQDVRENFDSDTLPEIVTASAVETRVFLHLRGVSYEAPPSVGFEVFVNIPHDASVVEREAYSVGVMGLFGLDHAHPHGDGHSDFSFEITKLVTEDSKVGVVIEPFDLLTPTIENMPRLSRAGGISIKSMDVTIEQREQ